MTPVALPAILDLAAASHLAEVLRTTPRPIVLDGADVERISVAGLQLLLSAHVTAEAQGHRLDIRRPSDPLSDAARTIGAGFLLASDR